ncbi:MAG: nucleotidyltransferase family protein [Mariprofundaceae bacterium]|nr:nucleotidyltransferase family protein [Mariprofundaceae bacterium]
MECADRAVVLAAGLGTRLKWLTDNRPKALMQVAGTPVLVHVIRRLAAQGIHDIAINVHHHAEVLMKAVGDGAAFGVRLVFSREQELLDSGGGVVRALRLLPGDGLVAVHNVDVLADVDIRSLAEGMPAGGACLALVPNPAHHPQGDFALADGLIRDDGDVRYTYAGVSVWDPAVFANSPTGAVFPLIQPMRGLMAAGRLAGLLHRGAWFDIGRPRDLMRARREWYG